MVLSKTIDEWDDWTDEEWAELSEIAFAQIWDSDEDQVWTYWIHDWQAIFDETFPLTDELKEAITAYKNNLGPLPKELVRKFADDCPRCVVKDGIPVSREQIIMTSN